MVYKNNKNNIYNSVKRYNFITGLAVTVTTLGFITVKKYTNDMGHCSLI